MSVLVTGGAGFVGSYVVRDLLGAGRDVVIVDRHPHSNALELVLGAELTDSITQVTADVTDLDAMTRLCLEHRVTHVVHLASPLTKDVDHDPLGGIRAICEGAASILEVADRCSVKRVVWMSSVAVFGPRSAYPAGPVANDAMHDSVSLYGRCKSLCEHLARFAFTSRATDSVGLRLSVVYGAGRLRGYMSLPSHLIREVALRRPTHFAYGPQLLNWQYVEDVAQAALLALFHERPGEGRTYNTFGDVRSYGDAGAILSSIRPDVTVTVGDGLDPALADVVHDYDSSEFQRYFGYVPSWTLERGVPAALTLYERIHEREAAKQ